MTTKIRGANYTINNAWVVPFNRLLCKIFNAHINVEICNSIKAIQYITKYINRYINKSGDMATFTLDETDEIKRYLRG